MIHTRQMKENGYLADDVNLRELAANTTQFSGAEIAGIVRLAASYALDRKVLTISYSMLFMRFIREDHQNVYCIYSERISSRKSKDSVTRSPKQDG